MASLMRLGEEKAVRQSCAGSCWGGCVSMASCAALLALLWEDSGVAQGAAEWVREDVLLCCVWLFSFGQLQDSQENTGAAQVLHVGKTHGNFEELQEKAAQQLPLFLSPFTFFLTTALLMLVLAVFNFLIVLWMLSEVKSSSSVVMKCHCLVAPRSSLPAQPFKMTALKCFHLFFFFVEL